MGSGELHVYVSRLAYRCQACINILAANLEAEESVLKEENKNFHSDCFLRREYSSDFVGKFETWGVAFSEPF
jgi:hypothetical protein